MYVIYGHIWISSEFKDYYVLYNIEKKIPDFLPK